MPKTYTVGEIFRLGLLKTHRGEPYRNKATIAQLVKSLAQKQRTPWGEGYAVTAEQISALNKRWPAETQ